MPAARKVSKAQLLELVEWMEAHPLQAKGSPFPQALILWKELAFRLNRVGDGVAKTLKGWRHYWNDLKCKIKKRGSGVHRCSFAPIYRRILKLVTDLSDTDKATIQENDQANDFANNHHIDITLDPVEDVPERKPSLAELQLFTKKESPSTSCHQSETSFSLASHYIHTEPSQASPPPDKPSKIKYIIKRVPRLVAPSEIHAHPRKPARVPQTTAADAPAPQWLLDLESRRLQEDEVRRALDERRFATEERRLAVEERRLAVEERRLALEERRMALEERRFEEERINRVAQPLQNFH